MHVERGSRSRAVETRGELRDNLRMPVYLITAHSYRSWNADNPRGYVQRGRGIQPPDPEKAQRFDQLARQERVRFYLDLHPTIIDGCRDICHRRGWRLHQVVVVSSHVHALVSWRDRATTWHVARDTIKRLLGWMLAKHTSLTGRKWFSRGGSRKRVRDRDHFNYLMTDYLPKHAMGRRGGSGWREDIGHFGHAYQQ